MRLYILLMLLFVFLSIRGHSETSYINVLKGPEFVKKQVELGYDVNAKDDFGNTPLMVAAFWNELRSTKILIEAGADVNLQDSFGSSAVDDAAAYGNLEIVKELVRAGANVNVLNNFRVNPLHSAAVRGHTEVVKYLIKLGIDINNIDVRGQTVLHSVRNSDLFIPNQEVVAEILVQNGAVDIFSEVGKKMTTKDLLDILRGGEYSIEESKMQTERSNPDCKSDLDFEPSPQSCSEKNSDNEPR